MLYFVSDRIPVFSEGRVLNCSCLILFLLRKARFFIMDQLLDILTEVNSDVDYETCDTLVDDGILDSFDIVSIVGELNDTFDINITPVDIVPENFNSAEAMWDMIQRLSE